MPSLRSGWTLSAIAIVGPSSVVTNRPSNRTSEYGVPASLRSNGSPAAHAAAAPAAAALTYSSSHGTLT